MKKNNSMRVAIIVIALTLITSCFVGTTFAKYTASANASDTARVAKFDVRAFDDAALTAVTTTKTVNLFDESKVYDTKDVVNYQSGAEDTDVKDAGASEVAIIAPGTWGTFSYTIDNDSEVNVTYKVDYVVNEAGVPLEWSVDGTNWTNDLANIPDTALNMDDADDNVITKNVFWRWSFNDSDVDGIDKDDAVDSALGWNNVATPSIQITVTFTQVD